RPIKLPPPHGDLEISKPLPIGFVDGVIPPKTSSRRAASPLNVLGIDDLIEKQDDGFRIETGDKFQSDFVIKTAVDSDNSFEPEKASKDFAEKLDVKTGTETVIYDNMQEEEEEEPETVTGTDNMHYDEDSQKRV